MEAVQSSLRCAAQYGHGAVTKLLLDNGANVAVRAKNGCCRNVAQMWRQGSARVWLLSTSMVKQP